MCTDRSLIQFLLKAQTKGTERLFYECCSSIYCSLYLINWLLLYGIKKYINIWELFCGWLENCFIYYIICSSFLYSPNASINGTDMVKWLDPCQPFFSLFYLQFLLFNQQLKLNYFCHIVHIRHMYDTRWMWSVVGVTVPVNPSFSFLF